MHEVLLSWKSTQNVLLYTKTKAKIQLFYEEETQWYNAGRL